MYFGSYFEVVIVFLAHVVEISRMIGVVFDMEVVNEYNYGFPDKFLGLTLYMVWLLKANRLLGWFVQK